MPALRLSRELQASASLLRARPVVTLALGAAIVTSLLSVCCGVGLVSTPWFMCELFAVQLSHSLGRNVPRTPSWIAAGLIMLGAVLLVSSAAWLTLLGASPELPSEVPRSLGVSGLLRSAGFYAALASAVAVLAILPWLYAPLVLLEDRARFDHALLQSAGLIVEHGIFKHARLSLVSHALQVSPPVLAAMCVLAFDLDQLPLFALATAPLVCATVPLGQGMIVSAYASLREPVSPSAPQDDRTAQRVFSQTGRHALVFSALLAVPLLSLLTLFVSLVTPSRVGEGVLAHGELMAELELPASKPRAEIVLPNTALTVSADARSVRITASDGGGAGELPLRSTRAIERVRISRVRDAFALEITQGPSRSLAFIDRAGVRLDDDLRARLLDRVPPAHLLLVLGALLITSLCTLRVLADLSRLRRAHAVPEARRAAADVLALDAERTLRRALRMALWLSPVALLAVGIAVRALLSD